MDKQTGERKQGGTGAMSGSESAVQHLVKCWEVIPHRNGDYTSAIFPVYGGNDDKAHHDALDFAKDVLEDQWDASAHDETLIPKVEMKIIYLPPDQIPEEED